MISTVVVSDVRLYREGLAQILRDTDDIAVEATEPFDEGGFARLRAHRPDVTLLDLTLREDARAVRVIAATAPGTRIVVLAVPELEPEIVAWVEAGIAGYVTRDSGLDELLTAIRSAAEDELVCSPRAAGALRRRVAAVAAERRTHDAHGDLTPREREVLSLIARGCSNKEIARALWIEIATVKNHVHNILEKLGVARRGEAVARVEADSRLWWDLPTRVDRIHPPFPRGRARIGAV